MAHQKVTKAYSANTGTANTFSYSGEFDVFKASEVVVSLDAVDLTYKTTIDDANANPRQYQVDTAAKTILIGGANLSSGTIIIRPVTDMGDPTARAVFSPGSSITAADLNNNQTQLLRKAMEYDDISIKNSGGTMVGHLTMGEDTTIIFEGATDDAYETTLTVVDPTADRTLSLPDESGTLLTTGGAGTVAVGNMGANSVDSDQYVDGSIDTVHIADANVTLDKIEPLASGKIILGNGSNRPAPVTLSGDVTVSNSGVTTIGANTVEIGMMDCEETSLTSNSNTKIPTSKAVADYVQTKIDPIGGLEVIETKDHFPETQPAVGVIISIENAGGIVISSNSSTTPDTVSSDTQVTINEFPNDITGTIADRVGLMVTSTGSGHIYNYHKALLKEADLVNLSSDIEDFGNRYRTGSSRTSDNDSSNDDGDLFFDQGANTMYVYDGVYNSGGSWKEVTSAGDFKILTIKDHDQASGGSGPTFNGSNEEFDLFDGSADASINSAAQLLVVLNGVVQKPNSGSFDGSAEGFYLNDTHGIKFCDPPASGSTLFVTQIGSATTLQVPADGSVTAAKIGSGAVTTAKIGADAVDATKIADDAVGAEHIEQLDADLSFADSVKAKFGAGNDLNIYHDGSNSYITEEGTGNLKITSSGAGVEIQKSQTEYLGRFLTDGAVELYYDNSKKIETTTNGVTVTGRIDAAADSTHDIGTSSVRFANGYFDTLYGDGSNLTGVAVGGATGTDYNDSVKVRFGTGNDIEIYHDGTDSYIDNATGVTYIRPDGNLQIKDLSSGEVRAAFNNNGAVELYHDGTKQCETTATGLKMQAPSGSNCILEMWADNAENNNDGWQINCEDNNSWNLHSYEDGAWERRLHVGAGDNGAIQMCWVDQADLTSGGIYLANANIASKIYAVSDTTNSLILFVNGNGTVGSIKTVGSATQFNTSSDYRLKENEVPLENAITKLKGLKPYTFNFKKYPDEKVDGFYAHEAAEVVPVAVTGTKDEMAPTYYKEGDTIPSGKHVGDWTGGYSTTEINPQGVDYGKFTPLLTKALQEAIAKIETLEAKVAALEAA